MKQKEDIMDQGLQILKQESKTLKRFSDLKRSGFFLIVFLVCFVLVAILGILGFEDVIIYIFITTFISFILGFIFMVKHIISSSKKEAAFNELLMKHLWQPILTRDTLSYDYDYVIQTNKNTQDYIIQHPLISSRASEIFTYQITNTSTQNALYALWYYSRSSNGQNSSTTTYFRGFAVETNIDIEGLLYVREDKWYSKLSAQFNEFKNYQKIDGLLVNGTFDARLKTIRNHIISMGFKDVSLINNHQKLMVLIGSNTLIPIMKKYNQETYNTHESFLKQLIKVMEYVADQ